MVCQVIIAHMVKELLVSFTMCAVRHTHSSRARRALPYTSGG